jgi:hypothetical protein
MPYISCSMNPKILDDIKSESGTLGLVLYANLFVGSTLHESLVANRRGDDDDGRQTVREK